MKPHYSTLALFLIIILSLIGLGLGIWVGHHVVIRWK